MRGDKDGEKKLKRNIFWRDKSGNKIVCVCIINVPDTK